MSSQDSDGESYVSHLIADPKTYGDLSPCGRTTDDEEDAHLMRIDDSSSEEEDVPLPQPGNMHVKFKKSSLPKRAKLSNIRSIPSCFRQQNKGKGYLRGTVVKTFGRLYNEFLPTKRSIMQENRVRRAHEVPTRQGARPPPSWMPRVLPGLLLIFLFS